MSTLDATLAAGRAAAEELMRETVRIYKQAPDVFDRTSGNTVPGARTTVYEGPGRVKGIAASTGDETEAADREVVQREYTVSVPWATVLPGVRVLPGDRIEVLASPDPRMAGLVLWATGQQFSSTATAWRVGAEDRS